MDYKGIEILNYNAFLGGKMVAHFLSGCDEQTITRESIYLLFPLIYKKESRKILSRLNKSSSLESAFKGKQKVALAGIEKRFTYFSKMTNNSLIVAVNDYEVVLNNYISINRKIDYTIETSEVLKEYFRACFYLGHILSKTDLINSYLKLGIRNL